MKGATGRALGDLFAATEAVGDDEPVGRGLADGGEQFDFADGNGHVIFIRLEAEGAGHAAAAGSRAVEVDAEAAQDGLFRRHLHQRLVMAVAVENSLAIKTGRREMRGVSFEKFAEPVSYTHLDVYKRQRRRRP